MNKRSLGVVCILASAVIFGFTPVLAALSYRGGNNGVNMAFLRALLPLPCLAVLARVSSRGVRMDGRQLRACVLAGVLVFGCTLLLYSSYTYIPVGLATTLHFLYPLYVVLYDVVFRKRKMGPWRAAGLALGVAGVLVSADTSGATVQNMRGVLLALGSGLLYAAYILALGYENRRPVPVYRLMFVVSLTGVPLCGLAGLVTGSLTITLTPGGWGYAVAAALLVSVAGCVLFQQGTRCVGEADAAILSLLEPIGSILFGLWLMNETLSPRAIFGSALILVGLLLNALGGRRREKSLERINAR